MNKRLTPHFNSRIKAALFAATLLPLAGCQDKQYDSVQQCIDAQVYTPQECQKMSDKAADQAQAYWSGHSNSAYIYNCGFSPSYSGTVAPVFNDRSGGPVTLPSISRGSSFSSDEGISASRGTSISRSGGFGMAGRGMSVSS